MTTNHHFKFIDEPDVQKLAIDLTRLRLAADLISIPDAMDEAIQALAALDRVLAESEGEYEPRQPNAATYSAGFTTPEEEIRRREGAGSAAGTPASTSHSGQSTDGDG